ncbi:hypothetical protein G4B88_024916 [Cannabis sativa]|uniref:Uncharacterized protein n=1 Tax=Cannabis sativa TaxID=3483 RepID=A0A7J6G9F9_CANSA|nr:hypothetical protein G4B88_024916 [Cannabis sativa]
METVVGVENSDEWKFEESGFFENSTSSLSSPKYIADPVVYKLVRVECDGRFVPATDDEVMEVEDFLVDDKTEMLVDGGKNAECSSDDGLPSEMLQLDSSEDFLLSISIQFNAVLLLQKYTHNEIDGLSGLPHSGNVKADDEKLTSSLEEVVPSSALIVDDNCKNLSGSIEELSKPSDEQPDSAPSTSDVCNNQKPDFYKLNGEICLDNLSIKELHEFFKATFGRETTVKDKLWLKRRITMGLTNSCDVATTTFTIKDNKLVNKENEESCKNAEGSVELEVETINNSNNSPTNCDAQMEDHNFVSGKRFNESVEFDFETEDLHAEQRAAKRVRKPTKRYIEELSEAESRDYSPKVHSSAKHVGFGSTSPKSCLRPVKSVSFNERIMLTRLDSLGGSGVQVPCVSRIRRSRPRKNIKALMRFHPSSVGMPTEVVRKALAVPSSRPDSVLMNRVSESISASEQIEPLSYVGELCLFTGMLGGFFWSLDLLTDLTSDAENDKQCSAIDRVQTGKTLGLKQTDSSEDTSDDNITTVPTVKGGMRRKHHRAWTLVEVMKLVEGVSKCGAGRWSEIKRLAFASYSYRTSVDLKDKWRNLLKASFAQSPPDDGMNSRKHASVPIPAPILLRVRQLAEMHSQMPPNLGSNSSLGGVSGRSSVHETRSGYL